MKLHGSLDNYIEMYRRRHGLSQEELAWLILVEQRGSVAQLERSLRQPNLRNLLALEIVLGVGIQELFAGQAERVREHVTSCSGELLESLDDTPTEENMAKLEFLSQLAHPDEIRIVPE